MLKLTIFFVLLVVLVFALVKIFDKVATAKNRIYFSSILGLISLIFGYLIYSSVMAPIRFDQEKELRFETAVAKMIDIKKAQMAYKSINGKYTSSFDSLMLFVDSEKFEIIERKDSSVPDVARNAAFGLSNGEGGYFKEVVITKSLGFTSVKDSLFKNSDRYKKLNFVKINDFDVPVSMVASYILVKNKSFATLKVEIDKNLVLKGMDEDLLEQEKKKKSIDEINGDKIILGSLEDVSLTGNWPKKYGNNE
ncbi:hypothetical protein [uncultured Flavobacterium sp.]|uniref:hypothetical protein n=1 Tax=uncultured Flavobacterium sp. TaxID=165435 RepID=UPI0030CA16C9|tara:strand:- start:310 stop:1062 length:753 start_codon:yes stop_codon:yes gene_type:complete